MPGWASANSSPTGVLSPCRRIGCADRLSSGRCGCSTPRSEFWEPPEGAAGAPPPAPTQGQPLLWPIEIGPDGQSIGVPWLGSHPEVETHPWVEIIETPTAICAVGARKDMGYQGWVTAVGIKHRIPGRLNEALGNRVCVDLHGHAMQVTSTTELGQTGLEG